MEHGPLYKPVPWIRPYPNVSYHILTYPKEICIGELSLELQLGFCLRQCACQLLYGGGDNTPSRECYPKTNFRCALALWQFPLEKNISLCLKYSTVLDKVAVVKAVGPNQVLLSTLEVELWNCSWLPRGHACNLAPDIFVSLRERIRSMKPCDYRKLYEVGAISCLLPTAHPVSVLPASYKPTVWCTALPVDVPHGPC